MIMMRQSTSMILRTLLFVSFWTKASVVALLASSEMGFTVEQRKRMTYCGRPLLRRRPVLLLESSRRRQQDQQQQREEDDDESSASSSSFPELSQVELLYGSKTTLVYDPVQERYIPKPFNQQHYFEEQLKQRKQQQKGKNKSTATTSQKIIQKEQRRWILKKAVYRILIRLNYKIQLTRHLIVSRLSAAFLPQGVTKDYYSYNKWRILQRWMNGILHVLGTQSLLMGLGIKSSAKKRGAAPSATLLGLGAALNWVLKDSLGKLVRMFWASKMGGRFDSDAKRWRYRAGFIIALGNLFEIVTYLFPRYFLLFATSADCCKQVSYLTASSTRTAIYNSFRDETSENIGDITAKGEASIAVVDLLGIVFGIFISKTLGASKRWKILIAYGVFQSMEIFCLSHMIRSVRFRVLNFERLVQLTQHFINGISYNHHNNNKNNTNDSINHGSGSEIVPGVIGGAIGSDKNTTRIIVDADAHHHHGEKSVVVSSSFSDNKEEDPSNYSVCINETNLLPTPDELAQHEKIFFPPSKLMRRVHAFGSLGRAKMSPTELQQLFRIFRKERFLLVVGANAKQKKRRNKWLFQKRREDDDDTERIQKHCHIVLHTEATNADIAKSSLALLILRKKLAGKTASKQQQQQQQQNNTIDAIRSRDCYDIIQESCTEADRLFPRFLRQMNDRGWTSPARFMFGRVMMRAEWPLMTIVNKSTISSSTDTTTPTTTTTATAKQQ